MTASGGQQLADRGQDVAVVVKTNGIPFWGRSGITIWILTHGHVGLENSTSVSGSLHPRDALVPFQRLAPLAP